MKDRRCAVCGVLLSRYETGYYCDDCRRVIAEHRYRWADDGVVEVKPEPRYASCVEVFVRPSAAAPVVSRWVHYVTAAPHSHQEAVDAARAIVQGDETIDDVAAIGRVVGASWVAGQVEA